MDVVLMKDVDQVGLRGDVVSVSRGFMRNYLQPRKLAEPATTAVVAELSKREADRAQHEARSLDQAKVIAETLTKTVLRFEVKAGPQGVLFGSITPSDVVDELWRVRRVRVDRRKVVLDEPIKRVGRYEVPIDVFPEVRVEVKTLVVPEGGELPEEEQAAEGVPAAEIAADEVATSEPAADGESPTEESGTGGAFEEEPVAAEAGAEAEDASPDPDHRGQPPAIERRGGDPEG